MRRFHLGIATVALPVFAFTLFLAGCGKDEKKADTSSSSEKVAGEQPKGDLKVLESKGGVLKGKITLKGAAPVESLEKELQAAIAAKTDQTDFCLHGTKTDPITKSETTQQAYRIGDNKQLGNVFVWVKPEKGTFFKVDEKQLDQAKKPIVMHQPHCAFIPHCAVVFAQYHADAKDAKKSKPTGQIILVKNDAEKGHNTNWKGGPRSPTGNETLAAGKEIKIENLVAESTPMRFQCNIHGWMDAYVWVLDTPYHAISHSDTLDGANKVKPDDPTFGTFEIKNLPVGKVRVFAWHERAGFLNPGGGREGDLVEIKEGAPTEKNFEGEAK